MKAALKTAIGALAGTVHSDQRKQRLILCGVYFGYPSCCIQQFVEEFDSVLATGGDRPGDERRSPYKNGFFERSPTHPWTGTGFIPCSTCAPVARADFVAFVCERIQPSRLAPKPFPQDEERSVDKIMKELGFDG